MLSPAPRSPAVAPPRAGLRPPERKLAAARAKYRTDGAAGLTGGRLVVALFERLAEDLAGAEQAIAARQIEAAHTRLVHAQDILDSLDDALDESVWEQAKAVSSLYRFLGRELVVANVRKDAGVVARCRSIVDDLTATWRDAVAADGSVVVGGVPS